MTESLYVQSASDLLERCNRLEQIITALELRMVDAGTESSILEYYILDDGQTKITSAYRDVRRIAEAIEGFEKLYQKTAHS